MYTKSISRKSRNTLPGSWNLAVFLVFTALLSTIAGCSSAEKSSTAVVDNGGFTICFPIKSKLTSISPAESKAIAAQFDSNEIPNTLLKKPVETGHLIAGLNYRLAPTGIRLPKRHNGVDYVAAIGTPVYAAGDGTVVMRRNSAINGNYLRIQHANGFETGYGNLDAFADGLVVGSLVSLGEQLGTVGKTGRAKTPQLHFELLYNGDFIDPLLGAEPEPAELAGSP